MKNIAIKNDNVGKKVFTLLPNISNFMKMLKNIINTSKKSLHKKTLRKNSRGLSTLCKKSE